MGRSNKNEMRPWSVVDNEQLTPNGYVMKWTEGMLKQCGSVGKHYFEWVDHPKLLRVRMFDSKYIEAASFTPWWIVPAIYIPWALLELELSHFNFSDFSFASQQSVITEFIHDICGIPYSLLCLSIFLNGLLLWTIFEYFTHKHMFHWEPPSDGWNVIHFIGHGMHHLTPADKYRLVFPPAVSIPLGLMFRGLFYLLFSFGVRSAMFAGFIFGYACYESIHYLSHHCPIGKFLQDRFKYHSAHHFNPRKQDRIFGVSSQIWDVAFDTL